MGVGAASIPDLIAIGFSRRAEDAAAAEPMAIKFIQRFSGIAHLGKISNDDIRELAGLEDFEILRAQALMELGRRAADRPAGDLDVVANERDVARLLSHLVGQKQEIFSVIFLDAKNQVMHYNDIHRGTLTMSPVGAREVFRAAVREGASSIIVAHNHPSGDPEPSPEDLDVTAKLVEAGKLLDIPLLDHVIIGDALRVVSLHKRGIIR
jgi:DNA repair protein RadC